MAAVIPFINWLANVNQALKLPGFLSGIEQWMIGTEDTAGKITKLFLTSGSVSIWLINLIIIAALPALGEEMLFRGIIQRYFINITKNHHAAVLITAMLFSLFHLQFYGFLPRLVLGAILGYLMVWSGNLWIPVIAHFFNNALGVTVYFLLPNVANSNKIDDFGASSSTRIFALISLIILIFLLWIIKKKLSHESRSLNHR